MKYSLSTVPVVRGVETSEINRLITTTLCWIYKLPYDKKGPNKVIPELSWLCVFVCGGEDQFQEPPCKQLSQALNKITYLSFSSPGTFFMRLTKSIGWDKRLEQFASHNWPYASARLVGSFCKSMFGFISSRYRSFPPIVERKKQLEQTESKLLKWHSSYRFLCDHPLAAGLVQCSVEPIANDGFPHIHWTAITLLNAFSTMSLQLCCHLIRMPGCTTCNINVCDKIRFSNFTNWIIRKC